MSQLVANRPPVPRQPGVPNNDASMWIGNVVGTDDFAPAAVNKKSSGGKRAKLAIGLIAAAAVAGAGGYTAFRLASGGSKASPSAGATPPGPTATKPVAAPAEAPADAAVAEENKALADAGPLVADAVSAADPVVKKATTTTKRTATKKTTKKKVATTTKKKRRRR